MEGPIASKDYVNIRKYAGEKLVQQTIFQGSRPVFPLGISFEVQF